MSLPYTREVEEFLFFSTIAKSSRLLSTLLIKMMSAHTFYTSVHCQSSPSLRKTSFSPEQRTSLELRPSVYDAPEATAEPPTADSALPRTRPIVSARA